VVINEVLYHPADDTLAGEFIELHNHGSLPVDVSGWFIAGGIELLIPGPRTIPGGGFLLLAGDPAGLARRYGLDPSLVVGSYERNLANDGELLQLWTADGYLASFVDYRDSDPWPETPDGLGPSLERLSPLREEPDPEAWAASIPVGGTPGAVNSVRVDDGATSVGERVEIVPPGALWRFLRGSQTPPPGWRDPSFDDGAWESGPAGFGFGDGDDATELEDMQGSYLQVYIRRAFDAADTSIFQALTLSVDYDDGFIAYLNGVEVARANVPVGPTHEAGSPEEFAVARWAELLRQGRNVLAIEGHNSDLASSDFSLSPALSGTLRDDGEPPVVELTRPPRDLVLNELSVAAAGGGWVELFNPTAAPVDASGRRLVLFPPGAGDHRLPAGSVLPPRGFLVVAEEDLGFELDPIHALLLVTAEGAFLDGLNPRTTLPGFSTGRFPDGSENRVVLPIPSAGEGNELDIDYPVVINEIQYNPAASSPATEYIELHNRSDAAVDLGGWAFTRGIRFEFPPGTSIAPRGYLLLAGDPAAVEARYGRSGVLGPWEGGLRNDAESLLLRDLAGNVMDRVRYADEGSFPESADGTGPSLELIAPDLENRWGPAWRASLGAGTPGAPNTQFTSDPDPIIVGVEHAPVIPDSTQAVRVLAVVSDERPVESVSLSWEVDGSGVATSVGMADDGRRDDGVAGNGVYGVDVPPQSNRAVVAFWIRAQARGGVSVVQPSGAPANAYLYQVEDAGPELARPLYRVVMRAANLNSLRTRGVNSNTLLDSTVVAAGRAYYNRGIRYRGSSARSCNPLSYRLQFDHDVSLHGIKRVNMNGCNSFRQWLGLDFLWRTGVPAPQSWFRRLSFNGQLEGNWHLRVEAIDGDFLERALAGDADGNLYRGRGQANLDYRGGDFNDYRSDYRKDTNEEENDYSDVVDLCSRFDRSTTSDEAFPEAIEERVDVSQWAAYFAAYAVLGTTENSILLDNGDDYFLYHRSSDDRWMLLPWDLDSSYDDENQPLFRPSVDSIVRFLHEPLFAPLYWCHLGFLMDTAFGSELMGSRIDHLASLFPQGQVQDLRSYVAQRRSFLATRLSDALTVSDVAGGSFCRGVLYPNRSTLVLSGRAPACAASFVLVNGAPASYDVETASWSGGVELGAGGAAVSVVVLDREGRQAAREDLVVDSEVADAGGGGLHEQEDGRGWVAFKAVEVARIDDPDRDGNVWQEVLGVDGALGQSRAVLRAPNDGNFRGTGNSHAVYRLRFRIPGVYRGYYRARGFNRNSDSLWIPAAFNRAPDIDLGTSRGGFQWASQGDFTVTPEQVAAGTVLELQIGVREFTTELDAVVLALDSNLSGGRLDPLVGDVSNPPRAQVEVSPGNELTLDGGAAAATLDGSSSHDGQCSAAGLTYLWEKLSGPPGDAFSGDVRGVSVDLFFITQGAYRYRLTVTSPGGSDTAEVEVTVLGGGGTGNRFVRCDANGDRFHNLTDALVTLNRLFLQGPEPACAASLDCNADGFENVTDAVFGLNHLFLNGPAPRAPYPSCDAAPAADCARSTCAS
jgi:hypothetical protein